MSKNVHKLIQNFNNQDYHITVKLINGPSTFILPPGILSEILIEDNINAIFPIANVTIVNTGNVIDEFVKDAALANLLKGKDYRFNTESKDYMHIRIAPVDIDTDEYVIDNLYAVYDEDEILPDGNSANKLKLFKLRDAREHLLYTTYNQWSTADAVANELGGRVNLSRLSNKSRSAKTGVAIRSILKTTLGKLFRDKAWDNGGNKIFYTSGTHSNALDDIEYLLDRHISEIGDNCILRAKNQDLNLLPISSLYNGYTPYGDSRLCEMWNLPPLAPKELTSDVSGHFDVIPGYRVKAATLDQQDKVAQFTLLNISNDDSNKSLTTHKVHHYSKQAHQFSIDTDNIKTIKDLYQNAYIDKLPKVKGKTQKAILPINDKKIDSTSVKHVYSGGSTRFERLKDGINTVLKNTLLMGPVMTVNAPGDTKRSPGRFSLVGMVGIDQATPLAKLMLGEWMQTNVVHYFNFTTSQYRNTVTCNKSHTFEEIMDKNTIAQHNEYFESLSS